MAKNRTKLIAGDEKPIWVFGKHKTGDGPSDKRFGLWLLHPKKKEQPSNKNLRGSFKTEQAARIEAKVNNGMAGTSYEVMPSQDYSRWVQFIHRTRPAKKPKTQLFGAPEKQRFAPRRKRRLFT